MSNSQTGWLLGGIEWMSSEDAGSLIERLDDPFYALDAEWRFLVVNEKAARLWGKRREDLIARKIGEVFPKSVGSEPWKAHERAIAENREVTLVAYSPVLGTHIKVRIQPLGDGLVVYFREQRPRG